MTIDSSLHVTKANTVSYGNLTCHNICKVTLTGYETNKHLNHLSNNYLYRDSTKAHAHRDRKYCAIPACYRDCFLPTNGTSGRIGALVTQTTTTAVPLAVRMGAQNAMIYWCQLDHNIVTKQFLLIYQDF
jgi:hypothetical protein